MGSTCSSQVGCRRSLVAALIVVILLISSALLMTVALYVDTETPPNNLHRQRSRRDVSTAAVTGDYVPVYREVTARTTNWNTNEFETTDLVDDQDSGDYDDEASWTAADDHANGSSPRGKEFAGYYAEFDDGQKFDDEEYETTFIKPGMHYGDNVEIVEQVR